MPGWGYTTDEGGIRVPLIAQWPGKVRAGRTCGEPVTFMDPLPRGERAIFPHEAFPYYQVDQIQAV
jgi:hypothetical protein